MISGVLEGKAIILIESGFIVLLPAMIRETIPNTKIKANPFTKRLALPPDKEIAIEETAKKMTPIPAINKRLLAMKVNMV